MGNLNKDKVVKVGVNQLNHPTPRFLIYTFRAILYLSALYVVAIQPNLELTQAMQAMINKWLLIGTATVNVTIKFFGLDFKN